MNANDIVESLPVGYRWANKVECDRRAHPTYFMNMVQVKSGLLGPHVFTDLAIKVRN